MGYDRDVRSDRRMTPRAGAARGSTSAPAAPGRRRLSADGTGAGRTRAAVRGEAADAAIFLVPAFLVARGRRRRPSAVGRVLRPPPAGAPGRDGDGRRCARPHAPARPRGRCGDDRRRYGRARRRSAGPASETTAGDAAPPRIGGGVGGGGPRDRAVGPALLLGLPSPAASIAHPAISDLLDPVADVPAGRVLLIAAWTLAGLGLLRRGWR